MGRSVPEYGAGDGSLDGHRSRDHCRDFLPSVSAIRFPALRLAYYHGAAFRFDRRRGVPVFNRRVFVSARLSGFHRPMGDRSAKWGGAGILYPHLAGKRHVPDGCRNSRLPAALSSSVDDRHGSDAGAYPYAVRYRPRI